MNAMVLYNFYEVKDEIFHSMRQKWYILFILYDKVYLAPPSHKQPVWHTRIRT